MYDIGSGGGGGGGSFIPSSYYAPYSPTNYGVTSAQSVKDITDSANTIIAPTQGTTNGLVTKPVETNSQNSAFGFSLDDFKNFADYYNKQANEYARQNAQTAMDFNSREAQKQRDWEEMMSNTAVSRYIKDLEANGLNKILAYSNSASTPSGASASAAAAQSYKNNEFTNSLGATLREGLITSLTQAFEATQNNLDRSIQKQNASSNQSNAVNNTIRTLIQLASFVIPLLA